jgi:hypothetical protein
MTKIGKEPIVRKTSPVPRASQNKSACSRGLEPTAISLLHHRRSTNEYSKRKNRTTEKGTKGKIIIDDLLNLNIQI